jgi:hypothetical protein
MLVPLPGPNLLLPLDDKRGDSISRNQRAPLPWPDSNSGERRQKLIRWTKLFYSCVI